MLKKKKKDTSPALSKLNDTKGREKTEVPGSYTDVLFVTRVADCLKSWQHSCSHHTL